MSRVSHRDWKSRRRIVIGVWPASRLPLSASFADQRGAVLVVGLLFLLLVTLIAAASMNTTIMEEKMAANFQYKAVAFQTAESAIARFSQPAMVKQTLQYGGNDFQLPAEQSELGSVFDPITDGSVRTRASARVRYCGQRSPPGSGKNAALNKDPHSIKLHAFRIQGRGEVAALGAVAANERVVGFLGPAAGYKQCLEINSSSARGVVAEPGSG